MMTSRKMSTQDKDPLGAGLAHERRELQVQAPKMSRWRPDPELTSPFIKTHEDLPEEQPTTIPRSE